MPRPLSSLRQRKWFISSTAAVSMAAPRRPAIQSSLQPPPFALAHEVIPESLMLEARFNKYRLLELPACWQPPPETQALPALSCCMRKHQCCFAALWVVLVVLSLFPAGWSSPATQAALPPRRRSRCCCRAAALPNGTSLHRGQASSARACALASL